DAAYALMVDIHQEYPNFAVRCHRYAHDIGLKSYIYYGTDVTLTPKTSYCNAGFFHGYMEGLISSTDNMTQAVEFCARVDRELNSEFPLAYSQCLHGIGHGVLEHFILTSPDLLSAPDKLMAEAVAVCESTIR